jgi:predicted nucleic acid-binding protein
MSKINLFLDSSALFAGIVSSAGASRAILLLAEAEQITLMISEQVVTETERAIARKVPKALSHFRQAILTSKVGIVNNPSIQEVSAHHDLIAHPPYVSIVVAAMNAKVDFLVTFNRKHFIDDPGVSERSGLRIATPGDALAWVRDQISAFEL